MLESGTLTLAEKSFAKTERKDAWWLAPLLTGLGLGSFAIYSFWAAYQGDFYWVAGTPYLSPLYSPEIFGNSPHSFFGPPPAWWPGWLPFSPAFLILWAPLGFRTTCYYYRKAYYRSFFLDPPACGVGEKHKNYKGETSFPFILQNIHRYFLYLAIIVVGFLTYDAYLAFFHWGPGNTLGFGVGLGSIILLSNAVLLGLYTFSCHSLRHLVGGGADCFSCTAVGGLKYGAWSVVSSLNKHHMLWAWLSLFSVGFADIYVRLVAMGIWTDIPLI